MSTIPGGKGANQAVGCSRLSAVTRMIGRVGEDAFGAALVGQLQDNGIDTSGVRIVEHTPSGSALICHTPEDNSIIVVPGANAFCTEAYVKTFKERISDAHVLLVQLEIPMEAVIEALRTAKAEGVTTILNPAPARELSDDVLELVDYLTPNESEWETICGSFPDEEERLEASLQAFEGKYNTKVIVTRGEQGASCISDRTLFTASAPKVKVVDTTGAGDAFNAALAVSIAEGELLEDAVRFAVRAASVSVQRFGAQQAMPTKAEIAGL